MAFDSFDSLLAVAVSNRASDLHLRAGSVPTMRLDGVLHGFGGETLTETEVERYLFETMPDRLQVEFKQHHEADFAYGTPDGTRFRVNAYRQRGLVSMAIRVLRPPSGDFASLGLPQILETVISEPRGLVLVTGPTGSGKSTTLAALIDHINSHLSRNIITVEDPIEVLHRDKSSMVSQREVGVDTVGFAEAMRRVLRQDPDVIMIGEMRDAETIDAALKAAETGHLVLSSLHTLDAAETINRILDFFESDQQRQMRLLLAGTLRAIISQRLLPSADGKGRVPAIEVLINTERVAERIADPALTHEIPDIIAESTFYGMETFDQSILRLASTGLVTFEEGFRHATKPADLKLRAQQMGLLPT
ncbi:MAG TPA: PilT/PilU family type 4a pilus ATPase [Acidimicrobiia bacterium]|nr:PilT/PilU family type 4a pilus ATPase [Acidimicrobiia bacterium]